MGNRFVQTAEEGRSMADSSMDAFRLKLRLKIDELREKREILNESINVDEAKKKGYEQKLPSVSMELSKSKDAITRITTQEEEIERAIVVADNAKLEVQSAFAQYKKVCKKEQEYNDARAKK